MMNELYKVAADQVLSTAHPLHVDRFYPHLTRHHQTNRAERQALILYLARLHAEVVSRGVRGTTVEVRLTSLRNWVHDYQPAMDHFFTVRSRGFNVAGRHELSTLVPKRLPVATPIRLRYQPPPIPAEGTVSKVLIQQHNKHATLERLVREGRASLSAPVEWLFEQSEVNFYFVPSGKLQQRDTSVYPVAGIENFPSWLREAIFGPGIDIDSAYTQFLLANLREAYSDRPQLLKLLYPDLIASLDNKASWRNDLCVNVLGLAPTDDNISLVKRVCMSLANGSRISPAILACGAGFSVTADIIFDQVQDVSLENLSKIGSRLKQISLQYTQARKILCLYKQKTNPSRINQKKVFASYFEWERCARYKIWEEIDRHGIHVHDGLDGVPQKYIDRLPEIIDRLNIRLST